MTDAAYSIGWWIESADEEVYGPASRATVQRLLQEGIISKNTLIRHCTQEAARPVVDQPAMLDETPLGGHLPTIGDRLQEFWPRGSGERRNLAEGDLPCARHRRPAVAICLRCHAPYCTKCQMKPVRKQFYFCRKCQANHNNRRFLGVVVDGVLMYGIMIPFTLAITACAGATETAVLVLSQLMSWGVLVLYVLRDALMGGAGPGKRVAGLIAVRSKDGTTPLSYGQAVVRFLPLLLPFFVIVEAILIYRDPLTRRLGDRWAKTRVIDSPERLAKVRQKTFWRLAKKGVAPVVQDADPTLRQFAQIGG